MKQTLLERIYKRILSEASVEGIDVHGLAVYTYSEGNERRAIIYDINKFATYAKRAKLKTMEGSEEWSDDDVIDAIKPAMVGNIEIGRAAALGHGQCYDSWEVLFAAGPKLGKLLYGLAFALTDNGRLTSDRFSVSPFALKRWGKEKAERASTPPFDDIDDPKTQTKFDDCIVFDNEEMAVVNRAYKELGWEKSMLKSLRDQHEKVKAHMLNKMVLPNNKPIFTQEDIDFVEAQIASAGSEFFNETYRKFNP